MNRLLPANIFKRGKSYAVRFNVPKEIQKTLGKKEVVRGLGTRDLSEAILKRDSVIRDIEAEIRAQLDGSSCSRGSLTANSKSTKRGSLAVRRTTVSQTSHDWLTESDGLSPTTKAKYRQHLSSFKDFSGDVDVREIDRQMALAYMDHLKKTPSERTGQLLSQRSLFSHQICLASFWRVLEHKGLVDQDMKNPFSGLLRRVAGQRKQDDPREKKLRPVTRSEAETMLRYCLDHPSYKYRSEMILTVKLLWSTGCRLNEIAALRIEDIEDCDDHFVLNIRNAKTEAGNRLVMVVNGSDCDSLREAINRGRHHPFPAHPENDGMLMPRLLRGGYARRPSHYLGKAMEKARKDQETASEWDMHSFRRNCVSALVNAGVPRELRNLAVGHSNKDDIGMSVYAKRGELRGALRV